MSKPSSGILVQRVSNTGVISANLHDTAHFNLLIKNTELYLLKLKALIEAARADNTLTMPHCPYLIERLEATKLVSIYAGPFDQYISDLSLASIEAILTHNNGPAALLAGGIDADTSAEAHGQFVYLSKDKGIIDGLVVKHVLLKPSSCPQCHCDIVDDAIEDHMKSIACMESMRVNKLNDLKLTQVDYEREVQLIRTERVPYEYHPTGYAIFVPAWVDQAIRTYDSMKSRGAFADMSLADYLTSMAEPANGS